MLSPEQVADYERDGFLVLPDFVPVERCRELQARAEQIVDEWEPSEHRTAFHTIDDERPREVEFLRSGGIVWCFFEQGAIDADGTINRPKGLAINKIGHAMHDLDRVFERFTYTAELAEVAADIGLADPLAVQSMYIFKQPGIGGEVTCHQDATFLYTDPITVTGFWFAIEDATIDNGCLWAAPGGHRTGLRQLFSRTGDMGDDAGTTIRTVNPTPLPSPPDDLVPLEVPAGTLVVLHGLLPHWSDVNRSPVSRHAYTVHCISGSAHYPDWNWLRRPESMPLRRLATAPRSTA